MAVPAKERFTESGPKSMGLPEECRRMPCSICRAVITTVTKSVHLIRSVYNSEETAYI